MRVKLSEILPKKLDQLISHEIRSDILEYERHKAFIGSHFLGGICALVLLPFYLMQSPSPSLLGFAVIAWLLMPALISLYVAKTGRLNVGYLLSSLSLGGLVSFLALMTGGLQSFLLPWLIVVPVEAALSGSRRIVFAALMAVCASLAGLWLATIYKVLPGNLVVGQNMPFLIGVGLISAVSYVGGLAMNIQKTHQRASYELVAREERYRLLAENATDMITRHDSHGVVQFASGAVKDILGLEAQDILENGLFDRVHVADRPAFLRAFVQALELSLPASAEYRLKDSQGRFIWVEMSCRPVRDNGDVENDGSLVAITRDITAHKNLTDDLREAKQEAEKASESKSHFLANMSHELRTPLNAIIGFSEVLKGTPDIDVAREQQEEYATIIHKSGSHLLSVVNDLLDMSKLDDGSMKLYKESVSLSDIALEVVALMSGEATKAGVIIRAPMVKQNIEIEADKRAVKQILINLLSNAIKFSSKGKNICLTSDDTETDHIITVKDEGIGIPEDMLPKLGKPFVQVETDYNRSHEGTGLGLSIVKGLVDLHGGNMQIESTLGEGTQVRISLPKIDSEEEPKTFNQSVKRMA